MYFNVLFNGQRIGKDGKGRVVLYVTLHGRARYVFPFRVEPSRWDAAHKRVRPGGNAVEFNRTIAGTISEAERLALAPGATAQTIVRGLGSPQTDGRDFYTICRERIDQLGKKIGYNTRKQKLSTLAIVERIEPGITLESLDHAALERIEVALLSSTSRNTVTSKLKRLQAMWNDATAHHKLELPDPFARVKKKTTPTMKRGLFPDEMDRVIAVDLSTFPKLTRFARDVFVLQYLLGGVRWSDVCRLRPANISGGMLTYTMHKSAKVVQWPVHPKALEILKGIAKHDTPYLLPILDPDMDPESPEAYRRIDRQNQEVNKALKVVAQLAGVPPISTHWARHSNSVKAILSGVGNRSLQDMMGHSQSRTTDEYAKTLVGTMHIDAYRKMYG